MLKINGVPTEQVGFSFMDPEPIDLAPIEELLKQGNELLARIAYLRKSEEQVAMQEYADAEDALFVIEQESGGIVIAHKPEDKPLEEVAQEIVEEMIDNLKHNVGEQKKKKYHKSGIAIKQNVESGILLSKSGGFIHFVAKDIDSKMLLDEVNERQIVPVMRKGSWYNVLVAGDPEWPKDKIPLYTCIEDGVMEHPKVKALAAMGLSITVETGLANYLKKAKKRLAIEMAAYPKTEMISDIPLFDRCVEGMILRCTKDFYINGVSTAKFLKGKRYSVSKIGEEGEESVTICWTPIEAGAEIAANKSQGYTWSEFDEDLEVHFTDTDIEEKYKDLTELFPNEVKQANDKLAKLNLPVYKHVAIDAAMMSLSRGALNAYPMRMGKTSSAIATMEIRGVQRIGVIVPNNARKVWMRELKRMGFTEGKDYIAVKTLEDLKKKSKYYLITQNWLRFLKDPAQDQRGTKDSFLAPSYTTEKVKDQFNKTKTTHTDRHNFCPKCHKWLWRQTLPDEASKDKIGSPEGIMFWTTKRGYRCRTKSCGYVNYELAAHANCPDEPVKGRQCPTCKIVDSSWVPGRYKRVAKLFPAVIVDEIHNAKADNSLTRLAVFNMRARVRLGLSGTIINNSAMDMYNPLRWLMNAPGATFPYSYGEGKGEFEERFCDTIVLEKPVGRYTDENGKVVEIKKTSKKIIPFLKNPPDFWKFTSGKIVRRTYQDKLYLDSLSEAGKFMPNSEPFVHKVRMVPEQAKLMLESIVDFKAVVAKMQQEKAAKGNELNMAMVQNMAQLVTLRILATCPEYLNEKTGNKVYTGVAGGGKIKVIQQRVAEAVKQGKKVVILTDFQAMQKTVADALKAYGVMHLKTSWGEDKRAEAIEAFQEDPKLSVFIAGTRTIREAVDLSAADVCICCDLLWSPAFQSQAWSRILAPTNIKRDCEIVLLASEGTVDEHIFQTFYSKLIAAEQALDHKALNRRAKQVNVKEFLDRIIETEKFLRQFDFDMEDIIEMPVIKATALSYGE